MNESENTAQAINMEEVEKYRAKIKARQDHIENAAKEFRRQVGGDGLIVIASFGNDFVVSDINDETYGPDEAKAQTLTKLAAYVYELARMAARDAMLRELLPNK